MDIKKILELWEEDSKISGTSLDEDSRKTPQLHAKYLGYLADAKMQKTRAEMQQKSLLKDKWLYYNGKMDKDEVESRGWDYDPLDGKIVMKGDMNKYYDADLDIQKSEERVVYWKTVCETLTEIVNNLNWRHQTIGNMIRWKMFESGS
jgi:hypothetical protein